MENMHPIILTDLEELRDTNGNLPQLKHTFTVLESTLILAGIPILTLYGAGLIMMIVGVTIHLFSHQYRIRNLDNRAVYLMPKSEFKKYQTLIKTASTINR